MLVTLDIDGMMKNDDGTIRPVQLRCALTTSKIISESDIDAIQSAMDDIFSDEKEDVFQMEKRI